MARKLKEFAVYKGDTFRFYTMPTYQRRLEKRADLENSTIVVDVSDY